MANSRLEKIGNIFTRVQGLLKSGAMKFEDRPIFFDIFKNFPPTVEPKYCREADPNLKIRPIFYAEDLDRANRDESTTLYNLNEGRQTRKPDENFRQPRQFSSNPNPVSQKPKEKIFDLKELADLKE